MSTTTDCDNTFNILSNLLFSPIGYFVILLVLLFLIKKLNKRISPLSIDALHRLKDQVVLITGASSGLGEGKNIRI